MSALHLTAIIRENYITMLPQRRGNKTPIIRIADYSERKFSDKSIRRLKRIGANWSLVVRYALEKTAKYMDKPPHFTFMTLTLASEQIHSDNEIKRNCFQPFFTEIAKATKSTVNYVWRAESQHNGNIHFHILFDRYIDIKWARTTWNRLQDRLGYIERSKATNPSGVTVQDVEKGTEKYLVKYITKYMSKAETEYKKEQFEEKQRADNQQSTHRIQKINSIQNKINIAEWNAKNPDKPQRKNTLSLVSLDKQRGIVGKQWGCSKELKDLDCRLDINMGWQEAGAFVSDCIKEGGELVELNEFVNIIVLKTKPLQLFIGATLFAQFWDIVAVQYLKIAPILEAYRYINFNIA